MTLDVAARLQGCWLQLSEVNSSSRMLCDSLFCRSPI